MDADVDADTYQEIRALFSTKWDPVILGIIGHGPCRPRDLKIALGRTVGPELAHSHVTRILARYARDGFVHHVPGRDDDGRPCLCYALTAEGRRHLSLYETLLRAHREAPRGDAAHPGPSADA